MVDAEADALERRQTSWRMSASLKTCGGPPRSFARQRIWMTGFNSSGRHASVWRPKRTRRRSR